MPNVTLTTLTTLSLEQGIYIITGGFEWSNSIIDQAIQIRLAGYLERISDGMRGGGGVSMAVIVNLSSTTTINLQAYQGTGSNQPAKGVWLKAYKLD